MNQECNQQQKQRPQHQEQQSQHRSADNDSNNMIMNTRPSIELNSRNNDDHLALLRATSSSSTIAPNLSTTAMRAHPSMMMRLVATNDRHYHHTHDHNPNNLTHSHLPNHKSTSAKISYGKPTNLGKDFIPGPHDCICGRGKYAFNHPGNKYFRNLIELARESYLKADTKIQRSCVVSGIIQKVRSKGVGFVKQTKDKSGWIEVGDHLARVSSNNDPERRCSN